MKKQKPNTYFYIQESLKIILYNTVIENLTSNLFFNKIVEYIFVQNQTSPMHF